MNILQITVSAAHGGGPKHVYDLTQELVKEFKVDIACPRQMPYWEYYSSITNGKMIEIPERRLTFKAFYKLLSYVRYSKPIAIHSHGKGAGVYGKLLSIFTGVPLVHTPHGIHLEHYGRLMKFVYLAYEKVTRFIPKKTIFVSASEKNEAMGLGFVNDKKSCVIHNGVRDVDCSLSDSNRIQIREKYGLDKQDFVVITLSRFDYPKNMLEMAEIAASSRETKFLFVGDGLDWLKVQEYCQVNNLTNVVLTGFIDDPVSLIQASDVYISSSRWEGLPLSVLEAMANGKPVLASNVVGNKDAVIHGETGFLYGLGNTKQASQFLVKLRDDKELRQSFGGRGKHRQVHSFSLNQMVESIKKQYINCIDK